MARTIDVVITTHEGWELTRRCLEHLLEQTVAHTVIVSDGASTDGTAESIRTLFPHVVLLTHADDPGYAAATNSGVAAGSGDVIVLLNNDAFCRPDFLEHVVAAFDVDEQVGAVAPLTVRSDERTIDSVGLTLDVTLAPYIRLTGQAERGGSSQSTAPRAAGRRRRCLSPLRLERRRVDSMSSSRSTARTSISRYVSAPSAGRPSQLLRPLQSTSARRRAATVRGVPASRAVGLAASSSDAGAS